MSDIMSDVDVSKVENLHNGELGFRCSFPIMGYRKSGIYRHGKAVGELMPKNKDGKMSVYQLRVRASNAKEIEELIKLIKLGKIQPEPGGSYDEPAEGPSYEEMKASYEAHSAAITEVKRQRDELTSRVEALEKYGIALRANNDRMVIQRSTEMKVLGIIEDDLMSRKWPYVSAKETAKRMRKIIDGTYS